ncbi:MAG: cell division protein FtsK [Candidatus Cloacimonetes bacterium]|nr:cell division protein FtsK [Candidatus Cloacimonadota bacterium]
MSNENKVNIRRIIIGVVVFLAAVLLLVSVSVHPNVIENDYRVLKEAHLSFKQIISLDFPSDIYNPIGTFGAFTGYWLIWVFGKFFGISLLVGIGLLGFFSVFLKKEKNVFLKIVFFILFAFFFNLFLLILKKDMIFQAGFIPKNVFLFLNNIFSYTGTAIISATLFIACIIIVFEIENVKNFLIGLGKVIVRFLKLIFKKKKDKPAKINKKEKKVIPGKEESIPEKRDKERSPNIIDHALKSGKEKPVMKPIIPKRKLSQDISKMPDEPSRKYEKPDIELFLTSEKSDVRNREEIEENIKIVSKIVEKKLAEFNVDAEVINVNIGPIITQYEIKPAPGVKVSKFHTLADDLALAIKAKSIRVQAPIPGKGLIGIEIPNVNRDTIFMKDIMVSDQMRNYDKTLAIALGKDISGNPVVADLAAMPHLLVAGATGSGKSVCVNTIINCLLLRTTPEEVRLVLIDPKRIELSGYEGVPHLIQHVVTNNEDALAALEWGVSEMERRYELLQKYKARNLEGYNKEIRKLKDSQNQEEEIEDDILPFIIIVVDEFADLMMTVGREVERPITRLAQMARAIGIHLVLATQRPSIKVITGIIKANFPSRIAFQVSSKIDSRVIIDANGADKLLGKGDMLFLPPGKAMTERIHGAFISDSDIHNVVEYLKTQPKPEQEIRIITEEQTDLGEFDYDDELFPEAAVAVVTANVASVSMLQRHFKIGYARAGRLVDMLERAGIIGPHVGSKSREVMATEEDLKIYGYLKE